MFGDNNILAQKSPSSFRKILSIVIIVAGCLWIYNHFFPWRHIIYEDGSSIVFDTAQDPIQSLYLGNNKIVFKYKDNNLIIDPVYNYQIAGQVVSLNHYSYGLDERISPVDLCIVWGNLVDSDIHDYINYSSSYRRCSYTMLQDSKYNLQYVNLHTSNNHLIPANNNIRNALLSIHKDDIIFIEGYLVNVDSAPSEEYSYIWHTSTIRNDSGCEIIYVTRLIIGDKLIK